MRLFDESGWMPAPQRIAAVLRPSFPMAAAATGVFFSATDPMEFRYCVGVPQLSRMGAYTVGFFLFWLLTAGTGLLAVFVVYPAPSGGQSRGNRDRSG